MNGSKKQYKYLLFDIDNTLMDFSAGEKAALLQTMEERNRPISEAEFQQYLAINAEVWARFEEGLLDSITVQRLRFERFAAHIGRDTAEAQAINDHYVDNLGRQAIVMDGATEMLTRLKARYQLAVVTNGLHLVQRARLSRSGFLPLLDGVFISQEMGVQKPDAAYFEAVFQSFGDFDRARYLVIGDSLKADILGGINAGIDTCWYHPAGGTADGEIQPTYTVRNYDELLTLLLP